MCSASGWASFKNGEAMTETTTNTKATEKTGETQRSIPARLSIKALNKLHLTTSGPAWLVGLVVVVAGALAAGFLFL
jgi:hypothetical protein